MRGQDLKNLIEAHGKPRVVKLLIEMLDLPEGDKRRARPDDFSLKELWEVIVGPVGETLRYAQSQKGFIDLEQIGQNSDLKEAAVNSTLYQVLAGNIIAETMIDAYNRVDHIGDKLVNVKKTKQRYEKVAGWSPGDGVKTVLEGQPYEQVGMGHKFVGTGEVFKKGVILPITEEAIFYDNTGTILEQADQIGEDARLDREKTILRAVLGVDTSYFPSDAGTSLYSSGTPQHVPSNALSDWKNLEAIENSLADTVDEQGEQIIITPKILLVPQALKMTAKNIINATEIREKEDSAGATTKRETVSANPVQGAYEIVSSPLIHAIQEAAGTSSSIAKSNYWLGDFKKQFVWKELWPIQVLRNKEGNINSFEKDVVAEFKVRYIGGIYAKDDKYVAKSLA